MSEEKNERSEVEAPESAACEEAALLESLADEAAKRIVVFTNLGARSIPTDLGAVDRLIAAVRTYAAELRLLTKESREVEGDEREARDEQGERR